MGYQKIAYIYLRLSNEDRRQGESGSITNQRKILEDYCHQNNIVIAREFADCVVFMTDNGVTVAVPAPAEGLSEEAVAQITDIICSETAYQASQLSIIEVKA